MIGNHPHYRQHQGQHQFSLGAIILHPITIAIWIVVCLGLSFSLWQSVATMNQSQQRLADEQQKIKNEEQKGLELIDKLNKADTPYAKEKIIRDELDMQRPGETVIQLPTSPAAPSPSPTPGK